MADVEVGADAGRKDDEDEDDGPRQQPVAVISIGFERARTPIRTESDVRGAIVEDAYWQLVQTRLNRLVHRPESPLLGAAWSELPEMPLRLSLVRAAGRPERAEAGLESLLAEMHQIERHGFDENEVQRAMQTLISSYEKRAHQSTRDGASDARNILAHFVHGDSLPAVEPLRALQNKMLMGLGVSELNEFARTISRAERAVLVEGPQGQLPDDEKLRAIAARVRSVDEPSPKVGNSVSGPSTGH